MKNSIINRNRPLSLYCKCLILCALGSLLGTGANIAYAEDSGSQEQQPASDQRVDQTVTLQGRVHRNESGSNSNTTEQSGVSTQEKSTKLKGEAQDSSDSHKLSGATSDSPKISLRGRKMTAEDYRALNYGILGIDTFKSLWTGTQTVDEVYEGCPAALAGIRPGDVEVQADDHVWKGTDFQKENWNYGAGEAGTSTDVTIRRHGQLMTFHLVRMNIEDIPNDKLRKDYEGLLRRYGPPKRGPVADNH